MRSRNSAFLLLLSATLASACTKTQGAAAPNQSPGGPGGGPQGAARALPVKAGPVAVQEVTYRIAALGSLEPDELVQVTAEVDGALTQVRFREGDRVGPGTVLALIDPERYRLEAARAEANYQKAVADQARADADFKRREALASDQLLSAEELSRSRTESEGLAAQAASAKAARDIAVQNLARAQVKPSRAGVIDKRLVDTGQFVRAGTALATLVDTSRLRLRFKISEAESLHARTGQEVGFRVSSLGEQEFGGEIYHVGQVADANTRQIEVLAWVRNPGVLRPGFFAEVSVPSESRKQALVVPETAIQASERGFVAFVIEDGKARVRQVQIGLRTGGGGVEIVSGLEAGQIVVYEGSDRLADGMAVRSAGTGGEDSPSEAGPPRPGAKAPGEGAAAGTGKGTQR